LRQQVEAPGKQRSQESSKAGKTWGDVFKRLARGEHEASEPLRSFGDDKQWTAPVVYDKGYLV
jgi:hypothetical protein